MTNPREAIARKIWYRHWRTIPGDLTWEGASAHLREECLILADTTLDALEDEGYWVAPIEPTERMLDAGHLVKKVNSGPLSTWRAMRDAAKGKGDE